MAGKRSRPAKDKGAALIMVLWGAVVMSIIAAAAARQATASAVVVNVGAELTRARSLADGGVRAGWSAFADGRANDFEASWTCRSGEDTLIVKLRPEAARIDINTAPPELLAALFVAAGADSRGADELARAVVNYREAEDAEGDALGGPIESLSAPEEPEAPETGTMRPGQFQTIEELGYLPGMEQTLFRAIADDITVETRALDVDRRYASPLVKRALDVAALDASEVAPGDNLGAPGYEGSLMNVRAVAVTRSGAVFVRDAVVEGPLDSSGMPRLLRFVQGRLAADEALPQLPDAPPCVNGFTAIRAVR